MASSSSSRTWVYDVFPSFSGEDVRVTFLSHFLKELDRKLIIAFKDNEIERSQSLDPELKQAIRTSRIAVVVFSEKYSSSSWCLDELVEIVKCKEELGQMVIPVFYGLDPSHVRKQTGKFGEAFVKTCQRKTEDETKLWRKSLIDVANVLGYHSQNWPNEAKMIEAIANDVLGKLNFTPSKDFEDFVGMEDHIAKMCDLLHLESEEVRMVGIWGSSGIGKTSIARALYNQLSHRFQGSIFIERAFVSKSTSIYDNANPDDYNMKLYLLRNFLSEILDKKDVKINHLGAVEEMLNRRKILIFIDDLDDQVVLDTLAGQTQWFGSGSRIIVVTNDKHLLKAHGIDHIYEVCLPSEQLALEMFCRYAFRQSYPPDGFEKLVVQVVSHVGSLPLGLNVLGSSLRGRDKVYWTDMLPRLQSGLDGKIEKPLRVSYDGLGREEDKAIFRHIASLFNYVQVTYLKLLLADSGLGVNIALEILADRSLIDVRYGTVKMHRLLQEMGRNIVRIQSIDKPEKREFLVDSKDICDVLTKNIGTQKLLGIKLDLYEIDELHIHENAFKGMCNLRFLEIEPMFLIKQKQGILHLPESFDYLPPRLKLLCWHKYPMRYMPSTFHPECLVKLEMPESKLEKLWEGVVSLTCLKEIDLWGSKYLKEIPNLLMAVNLEKLILVDCSSLVELPSSIRNLNKLEQLDMSQCSKLETLPVGMNLKSLDCLSLEGCSRLKSFPEISTNISKVYLNQTAIERFPSNLRLENLSRLEMQGLKSEKLWEGVQPLTPLISMLSPSLTCLYLSHIPSLVEIPSSIQNFTKLYHFQIANCINLETLPTGINLESLSNLCLVGCSRLKNFPDISTNISSLYLNRTGIEEVPWWIKKFSKLTYLYMNGCSKLQRVSLHISYLKHLQMVQFIGCRALTEANWNDSLRVVAMAPLVHNKASSSFPDNFLNCFEGQTVYFKYYMTLSGVEVPSFFTHRSTGTSLTNIPLLHTSPFQPFFRFKACAVLDPTSSVSFSYLASYDIFVSCRFKDRLGNHFDTPFQRHNFYNYEEGIHLVIFDCFISLKEHNHSLAERNYDHVDIQFHLRNTLKSTTLILKGWGIHLFKHFSSATNRLGIPNTLPHVETEKSRKRMRIM